jgi:hypothetical protein
MGRGKDITPQTDSDTQVTVGDSVRLAWTLDAQVDPSYLTFTVYGGGRKLELSGGDLTEKLVEDDGERLWRYSVEVQIEGIFAQVKFELDNPQQESTDTAFYNATPTLG